MQTRIQGTTMPVLDIQLDPNESVFSESGELSWMTASIQMSTHTQMGGGGGLFGPRVFFDGAAGGSGKRRVGGGQGIGEGFEGLHGQTQAGDCACRGSK